MLCEKRYTPNNKEAKEEYNEPEGAHLSLTGRKGESHYHSCGDKAQDGEPDKVL
jgi:hypothetical protein